MPNLTEIKERITSTSDTRKIASSLQLVAASKMKGYVRKALSTRQYATGLLQALELLTLSGEDLPFQKRETTGKHAFILITSDKGLCGSLNQKLIRFLFDSPEWQREPKDKRTLITIGRKGTEAAKSLKEKPILSYPGIGEDITPLKALGIIDEVLKLWHENFVDQISIVSPHYVSPFINQPTLKTFLPFSVDMVKSHLSWHNEHSPELTSAPLLEPDPARVTESLAFQIIQTLFTESFYELKASEYSSRMVAMKKATDSATDLISELTLEYNKARQAAITQQVSELASAAEATEEQ